MTINPFQKLKGDLNEQSTKIIKKLGLTVHLLNKPIREIKQSYNEYKNELKESYKEFKNELDFISTDYYHKFLNEFSKALKKDNEPKLKQVLYDLINHNKQCLRIISDQKKEREQMILDQKDKSELQIKLLNEKYLSDEETEEFIESVNKYTNKFRKISKAIDLMDWLACEYTIVRKEYRGLIPHDINHLHSLYHVIGERLVEITVDNGYTEEIYMSLIALDSLIDELNNYLPSHLTKPLKKLYSIPYKDFKKDPIREKMAEEFEMVVQFGMNSQELDNKGRSYLKRAC